MTTRRTIIIFAALTSLILSACQPQVELQPAGTIVKETAVPSRTPSLETIIETPFLEAVTVTTVPEVIEENVMPTDPASQPADPTAEESAEPEQDLDSGQPSPVSTVQPVENDWTTQAKADLALRQARPLGEIELLSFESKVWPDSSLGCPQPGWNYLQVLTEGYLIRLAIGDKVFHYHGGSNREPFLCKQTGPEKEITRPLPPGAKLTPTKSIPPPIK